MAVQQINIGVWLRDLDKVYQADAGAHENSVATGTIALLKLITLQLAQAHELVASLSDDAYVQRNIKGWRDDYASAQARLGWMLARLDEIVTGTKDPSTRALEIWHDIAAPILQGDYPATMMSKLVERGPAGTRGIRPKNGKDWSDGGKGFGEAFNAATLWNQAAASTDAIEVRAPGWAANAVAAWLTETARQLEASAPGEDKTLRDHTVVVLKELAAAPGAILAAAGISPTVVVVGLVAVVALIILLRR